MGGRETIWASLRLLRLILGDRNVLTSNDYASAIPNSPELCHPSVGAGSATAVLQKHLTNLKKSSKMDDLLPFTHTLEGKEDCSCLKKHPLCDQRTDTQLKQIRGVERTV